MPRVPHKVRRKDPLRGQVRDGDFRKVIYRVLRELDTPRALAVWLLFSTGEHAQLVQLKLDPTSYVSRDLFRRDYQATKLFSKTAGLTTGIDVDRVAYEAADQAEAICADVNSSIRLFLSDPARDPRSYKWLNRAAAKIEEMIGEAPDELSFVGWSPGRTTSAFGDRITPVDKFASRLDVTPSALPQAIKLVNDSPHWGQAALKADGPCSVLPSAFTLVEGNVMTVVPKNAKTSRVICYEPHCNIALQLAAGEALRRRMRRHGINLSDQSINARRALLGSKYGHLSTIDLSMASDTVAADLVRALLPPSWWRLLNRIRSASTLWHDGKFRRVEKFSSMGNGFTFELESLIFYALASAVSGDVSVYGDDIIVPTARYWEVTVILRRFGFAVNSAKSFSYGSFRESCGMDAFGGYDCTPFFIRSLPRTVEDVVKIHNALFEWVRKDTFPDRGWLSILNALRDLCDGVPRGPCGFGDGHLSVSQDERNDSRFINWCWSFPSYVALSRVNRLGIDSRKEFQVFPEFMVGELLASALGPKRPRSVFDILADRRYYTRKRTWVVCHEWHSIGWIT